MSLLCPRFLLVFALLGSSAATAPSKFIVSTFVPQAAPTIVSSSAAPEAALVARRIAVASRYGLNKNTVNKSRPYNVPFQSQKRSCRMRSSALLAKKKGAGATKKGKVQVKLLKFVQGTGKAGDVVMVAPAFFENKLKREESAVLITDEEVETETKAKEARDKDRLEVALDLQNKIEGIALEIAKKAGPEGHLFGGVSKKEILLQLKKQFPKGALDGKHIKIVYVKSEDGKDLGNHDIKDVGEYSSSISLLGDVTAGFTVSIKAAT